MWKKNEVFLEEARDWYSRKKTCPSEKHQKYQKNVDANNRWIFTVSKGLVKIAKNK